MPVWNDKSEPLAAFYNVRCAEIIERLIKDDKLSMKHFIDQLNIKKIDLSEIYPESELEKLFFNINTPEKLEAAKKIRFKSGS